MADEAFALSPISARPTLPGDAEYEAISNAFMETSRGRWFLDEYARRNRNADTRMVLDAVARIERTLATQKTVPASELDEILPAVASIVEDGRTRVLAVIAEAETQDALAPAYRGARTIREIAWTLRECGADQRICDSLDTQARAIDAGLERLAAAAPREAVDAVFDDLMQRIADLAGDEAVAAAAAAEKAASNGVAMDDEPAPSPAVSRPAIPPEPEPASDANVEVPPRDDASRGEMQMASDAAEATAIPDAPAEDSSPPSLSDAEAAQDDAVLDMIATEMAAADPDDTGPFSAEPEPANFQQPAAIDSPSAAVEDALQAETSLGAVLLARGAVRRPATSTSRFAAIRRLSQIEKIALFS
jgi:hypothetical protein